MNMYRALGDRIGTLEARALAQQLVRWHDAMVKHLRAMDRHGRRCAEGCPHEEARTSWLAALDAFGDGVSALGFLQRHGSPRPHHGFAPALEVRA
jgi:hypothetical protein